MTGSLETSTSLRTPKLLVFTHMTPASNCAKQFNDVATATYKDKRDRRPGSWADDRDTHKADGARGLHDQHDRHHHRRRGDHGDHPSYSVDSISEASACRSLLVCRRNRDDRPRDLGLRLPELPGPSPSTRPSTSTSPRRSRTLDDTATLNDLTVQEPGGSRASATERHGGSAGSTRRSSNVLQDARRRLQVRGQRAGGESRRQLVRLAFSAGETSKPMTLAGLDPASTRSRRSLDERHGNAA